MAYIWNEKEQWYEIEVPGVTPFGAPLTHSWNVGDKLWFRDERLGYTIQAADGRFVVCSKPMNALKTVLYCIVDAKNKIRGPENLVFGLGAETKEQCEEMLKRIQEGETEISQRHKASLHVIKWEKKKCASTKSSTARSGNRGSRKVPRRSTSATVGTK